MPLIQVSNLSRKPRGSWESRRREKILFPPERVWSALTDPEQLKSWWCDEVDLDLREGGRYAFSGKTVFSSSSAEPPPATGKQEASGTPNFEILSIEELARLEYRWCLGGMETTVLYELESSLEQTELTVTQSAERCPVWETSDGQPNWWWTALPTLRTFIEDAAPELRLDYLKAAAKAPLRFEALVPTYPWLVWTKLFDPAEVVRWWPPSPLATSPEDGGPPPEGCGPAGREVLSVDPPRRLENDWRWKDGTTSRIEWNITETEGEDTIVSITDHDPAEDEADRVQRAIYWASTLLSLLQVSRTGTAPQEYQEA